MFSKEKLCEIYNNEQVLMVLISRLYFDKQRVTEVQEFIDSAGINWNLFYKLTKEHHVRPFIYNIIKTNKLKIDGIYFKILTRDAFKASIINLHQVTFLSRILKDFENLGITVIPYKGVLLGARYYGSQSIREGADIDLFVDKKNVRRLRKYFHEHQYIAKEDVPDDYLNYMIRFYRDISFKTPKDSLNITCTIEIQWKLVDGFVGTYANFGTFEPHLEEVDIGDAKLHGLSVTYDFIAIISNHFFKEHFNRFKYVIDAACILSKKNDEIDKAIVASVVKKYHFTAFFNGSVQCIDDLLGIKYGDEDRIKGDHQIILNNAVSYPVEKIGKNDKIIFDLQDNYAGKMILALRRMIYFVLPNYNDITAFKMRSVFLPVLFLTKPIRLLIKYFGGKNFGNKQR